MVLSLTLCFPFCLISSLIILFNFHVYIFKVFYWFLNGFFVAYPFNFIPNLIINFLMINNFLYFPLVFFFFFFFFIFLIFFFFFFFLNFCLIIIFYPHT